MMTKIDHNIIRLPQRPFSRFHFGQLKYDENVALTTTSAHAHSDTLFSALVHGYARLNGNAEDFIQHFIDKKITISSLFFYISKSCQCDLEDCNDSCLDDDRFVYFLPKPTFLNTRGSTSDDGRYKERNKISFVSKGVWEQGFRDDDWFDNSQFAIVQGKFVMTRDEFDCLGAHDNIQIYDVVSTPKSPQRSVKNAGPFYQTDVEFNDLNTLNSGWYFLYKTNDDRVKQKLVAATNMMAYSGIGGESNNMGRTPLKSPVQSSISFSYPSPSDPTMNIGLSMCSPAIGELSKITNYRTALTQLGPARAMT